MSDTVDDGLVEDLRLRIADPEAGVAAGRRAADTCRALTQTLVETEQALARALPPGATWCGVREAAAMVADLALDGQRRTRHLRDLAIRHAAHLARCVYTPTGDGLSRRPSLRQVLEMIDECEERSKDAAVALRRSIDSQRTEEVSDER